MNVSSKKLLQYILHSERVTFDIGTRMLLMLQNTEVSFKHCLCQFSFER